MLYSAFLHTLFAKKILYETGAIGIYGRSDAFERVVNGIDGILSAKAKALGAEAIVFPPEISASTIRDSEYYRNFPDLLANIHSGCGCEGSRYDDLDSWSQTTSPTDLFLTPAACYPLYPLLQSRGHLPLNGVLMTVKSYCFRSELSHYAHRLRSFRMREFVRVGSPSEIEEFREFWYSIAGDFVASLELESTMVVANDPFFGREGGIFKSDQRAKKLKYELLISVDDSTNAACISFNNHLNSFTRKWGITFTTEENVHSGCVAFGLERIALALFFKHGLEPDNWPIKLENVAL